MTLGIAELERLVTTGHGLRTVRIADATCRSALACRAPAPRKMCEALDQTGGVADRRLPDRKPLLHPAVTARPACGISMRWPITPHGRSCSTTFPTGPASISGRRRCSRELAETPQHRGHEGSLRRSRPDDRFPAPVAGGLSGLYRRADRFDALTDGADGGILLSRISKPKPSPRCRRCSGKATASRRIGEVESVSALAVRSPSRARRRRSTGSSRTGLIDSAEVRLPMVEVSDELAVPADAEIERGVLPRPALAAR